MRPGADALARARSRCWMAAVLVTTVVALPASGLAQPPDGSAPAPPADGPDVPDEAPDDGPDDGPDATPDDDDRPWAVGISAEDRARANALFEEGDDLLRAFQLLDALDRYQQALQHWQHPAIHFRMASVLFSLGRPVEAYEHTQKSLAYGEAPLGEQFYQGARRYEKLLDETLAWVTITCQEPGAEVRLDGAFLFQGPGSAKKLLQAGPHTVVATRDGLIPATESLSLEQGSRTSIDLVLRQEKAREVFYPTVGRVGGSLQVLVDVAGFSQGLAASAVASGSYGLLPKLDVAVGGVIGGSPGMYLSSTLFLRDGTWRPTVTVALPLLWSNGFQPGVRAGIGFEWTPRPWFGIVTSVGVDYFPRADETHVSTLLTPAIGFQVRR